MRATVNGKANKMKKKKRLTNKQYQKYIIKNVIQLSAYTFLLGIVFVAIWKEIF